jgi:nitrite reductase (NADH) small subunit
MSNWIRAAATSDCPPGQALELVLGDRIVALFNVDGAFHAMDGICPHQGGPLGKGELTGCMLTCPWHGWRYDVTTGKHETSPLTQPCFDVKVDDDEVFVDVSENDS